MTEELSPEAKLIHQVFKFTKVFISEAEAKEILATAKEAGWDQRLQESAAGRVFIPTEIRTDAGDMLEAGWRKVKEVK